MGTRQALGGGGGPNTRGKYFVELGTVRNRAEGRDGIKTLEEKRMERSKRQRLQPQQGGTMLPKPDFGVWSRCVPAALHFLALDTRGINDYSESNPVYLCQLE